MWGRHLLSLQRGGLASGCAQRVGDCDLISGTREGIADAPFYVMLAHGEGKTKIQNPAWSMVLFRGQIPGGTGLVSESSEPGFQLLATHIRAGFLCRAV